MLRPPAESTGRKKHHVSKACGTNPNALFCSMATLSTSYFDIRNISGTNIIKRLAALDVATLELSYHYNELPGPADFEIIFEKFAAAPIGYWHDTGHAHAQESLGLLRADELLIRYHQNLVGVHLHDARGLDDHLPPGSGDIDFKKIGTWIGNDVLKVIELKPGTPDSAVAAGIHYLREKMML